MKSLQWRHSCDRPLEGWHTDRQILGAEYLKIAVSVLKAHSNAFHIFLTRADVERYCSALWQALHRAQILISKVLESCLTRCFKFQILYCDFVVVIVLCVERTFVTCTGAHLQLPYDNIHLRCALFCYHNRDLCSCFLVAAGECKPGPGECKRVSVSHA